MGLYKCEKCGCVENTALGWYWTASLLADDCDWSEVGEEYKGKKLCSECAPKKYKDGKPTGFGKWHGHFPKTPFPDESAG